jgi:hypothetical protein
LDLFPDFPDARTGWYRVHPTISRACIAGGSPTVGCTSPDTLGDGAGQLVTGTVIGDSGRTATRTIGPFDVDTVDPTITATRSPAATPASGWFRRPVTLSYACADATSRIATCSRPITTSTSGKWDVTGIVTDRAGNEGVSTTRVQIDVTAPTLTIRGPRQGATYHRGRVPAAGCAAVDRHSGVARRVTTLSGPRGGLGTFTYRCTAADRAGNTSTRAVTYTVTR